MYTHIERERGLDRDFSGGGVARNFGEAIWV